MYLHVYMLYMYIHAYLYMYIPRNRTQPCFQQAYMPYMYIHVYMPYMYIHVYTWCVEWNRPLWAHKYVSCDTYKQVSEVHTNVALSEIGHTCEWNSTYKWGMHVKFARHTYTYNIHPRVDSSRPRRLCTKETCLCVSKETYLYVPKETYLYVREEAQSDEECSLKWVCKCQKETYLCVSKEAHRGEESVSGSCASVHSFFSFFSQHQTHAVAMSCTLFLCSNEVYINYTLEMNLVTYTSDTHLITKCGCMKHAQGDTHAHTTQHHHHNRMHTYMRV